MLNAAEWRPARIETPAPLLVVVVDTEEEFDWNAPFDRKNTSVEHMREIGVGQLMCWMNFGGLPEDKVRRSMELFAREVMPRFR